MGSMRLVRISFSALAAIAIRVLPAILAAGAAFFWAGAVHGGAVGDGPVLTFVDPPGTGQGMYYNRLTRASPMAWIEDAAS